MLRGYKVADSARRQKSDAHPTLNFEGRPQQIVVVVGPHPSPPPPASAPGQAAAHKTLAGEGACSFIMKAAVSPVLALAAYGPHARAR
jgi:hypothetical protein